MDLRKVLLGLALVFMTWDLLTTFYGTLLIFLPYDGEAIGVLSTISYAFSTNIFVVVFAIILALMFDMLLIMHSQIMSTKNPYLMGFLAVGFVYDFATTVFGTAEVINMDYNYISQWFLVIFFAVGSAAGPIWIGIIYAED